MSAAARFGGWLLLFGAGYFLTARLSEAELFGRSRMGLFWAPTALLLSALILTSRRSWWLIFAAASIAHVLALGPSTPAWRMAWQLPVYAAFVIAMTEALRHFVGFPIRFESRRELLIYLGLAFIMPVSVALTAPGFILSAAGAETYFSPSIEFARLMLANITPALLVAPAALLAAARGPHWLKGLSKRRVGEASLIMSAVLIVGIVALCSAPAIGRFPWLLVLTIAPLMWAAVRLGPLGASLSLLCTGALSIAGAASHLGPFVINANDDAVLALQLYWIAIALPVLLLAAAIREREIVARALDDRRRELTHVSQLAVVGEVALTLGNQLSQPLTAILANVPAAKLMVTKRPIDEGELQATLSDIESEAAHAANVINQFRRHANKGAPYVQALDVAVVVRAALGLSTAALALAQVEVETLIAPGLPHARADRIQLLHVLVNLIANGCDAMRGVATPRRRLRLQVTQPDPRHVEIVVADSGVGLPNGEVERVFEPFFTTKPDRLGLGLPMARSFAVAHGSQLWGECNRHGGTSFHLALPVDGPTRT